MPSKQSTDQDAWPTYIASAVGLDRSWTRDARCVSPDGVPKRAWVIAASGVGAGPVPVRIGDRTVSIQSRALVDAALMICRGCPAQWDCATFGIESLASAATYAAPLEDIQWLGRQTDWRKVIEAARRSGASVQTAIAALRLARPDRRKTKRA